MIPLYHMVPRYHATMGTIGTMATTLPRYHGTKVPWYHEFRTLLGRPEVLGGLGVGAPQGKGKKDA